ncbi:hypothetical protein ACFLWU_06870 [Chloroflexota bacterium]
MVTRTQGIIASIFIVAILLASGCIGQEQESEIGKIAFVSNRDGNKEIYVINTDGSGIRRLTNNNSYNDIFPVLSPDGKKIAFIFVSYLGTSGLFLMNTDGGEKVKSTDNLTDYGDLEWSPDGTKILFIGRQDKKADGIYTINADGSGLRKLTNGGGSGWAPTWSPDGTKIAFTMGPGLSDMMPPGTTTIWVMNSDGSNQVPIKKYSGPIGYAAYPDWSPDGEKLVFVTSIDGILQTCVMNADGSDQVNLSKYEDSQFREYWAEWSPNGSKIAFVREYSSSGEWEIVVMNPDGSDKRVVSSNCTKYLQNFAWSPDGNRIAYASKSSSDDWPIYIEDADGSNKYALTSRTGRNHMITWSK